MIRKVRSVSLREQRLWANLVIMLGIYGWYAVSAWRGPARTDPGQALGLIVTAVIYQGILLVLVNIALAVFSTDEPKDERDLRFELWASRASYLCLSSCVMLAIPLSLIWAAAYQAAGVGPQPIVIGHALLLSLVAAEVVACLAQVIQYRWGP